MAIIFQMESVLPTYAIITACYANNQAMERRSVLIVGLDSTPTLQELAYHVFPTVEYVQEYKLLSAYNVDLDSTLTAPTNVLHVQLTQIIVPHVQT